MANNEIYAGKPVEANPVFTQAQEKLIACSFAKNVVMNNRDRIGEVGQPLNPRLESLLTQNCGQLNFSDWVKEAEAQRQESHRAIEALKQRGFKKD